MTQAVGSLSFLGTLGLTWHSGHLGIETADENVLSTYLCALQLNKQINSDGLIILGGQ